MNELDLPRILQDFSINIVAIVILAFFVYYRRHRRRDATVGYIATNVSLFVVAAACFSAAADCFSDDVVNPSLDVVGSGGAPWRATTRSRNSRAG
jgi:hypothetical protein